MIMCIAVPFSQDKIHLALFSQIIEHFSVISLSSFLNRFRSKEKPEEKTASLKKLFKEFMR